MYPIVIIPLLNILGPKFGNGRTITIEYFIRRTTTRYYYLAKMSKKLTTSK